MLDSLIPRLAQGDNAAFEQLYNDTYKAVYYMALSVTHNRALAEDVMQITYMNIIKNASSYCVGTNALAWILRITKNAALNIIKTTNRENCVDTNNLVQNYESAQDESALLVDLARKTLPDDVFAILIFTLCGYKRREISEIMEMPTSTVSYKYKLALTQLRCALQLKDGK